MDYIFPRNLYLFQYAAIWERSWKGTLGTSRYSKFHARYKYCVYVKETETARVYWLFHWSLKPWNSYIMFVKTKGFYNCGKMLMNRTYIKLLLTEQEVCMGEPWPRSWVQTERMFPRPSSRFSPTDRRSSVNKMFIIWRKQQQYNWFNVTVCINF